METPARPGEVTTSVACQSRHVSLHALSHQLTTDTRASVSGNAVGKKSVSRWPGAGEASLRLPVEPQTEKDSKRSIAAHSYHCANTSG